jgi:hypothetical protein
MVSKEQKFPADFTNSSYKKAIDSFYNKKKIKKLPKQKAKTPKIERIKRKNKKNKKNSPFAD